MPIVQQLLKNDGGEGKAVEVKVALTTFLKLISRCITTDLVSAAAAWHRQRTGAEETRLPHAPASKLGVRGETDGGGETAQS